MRAVRDAGYRTSLFGKAHLHPHRGDLRDRAPLLRALRAGRRRRGGRAARERPVALQPDRPVGAGGRLRGVQADLRDRPRRQGVGRPALAAAARALPRRLRRPPGRRAPAGASRPTTLDVLGELRRPARAVGRAGAYASRYDPATMPPPRAADRGSAGRPRGVLDAAASRPPSRSSPATSPGCGPTTPATSR